MDSLNSPDTEDKPDDNADIAKDQKYGASSKVFCLYDVEPEKEAAKENTSSDQVGLYILAPCLKLSCDLFSNGNIHNAYFCACGHTYIHAYIHIYMHT